MIRPSCTAHGSYPEFSCQDCEDRYLEEDEPVVIRASKAQTPQKPECGREIVLFLNGQRTWLFRVVTREELEVADIALLPERRIVCTCGDSFKDWGDFEEHQDKANLHLACGRERHSPEEW